MCRRMHGEWKGLTGLTEVEVQTRRMHALVTDANDLIPANIANSAMNYIRTQCVADYEIVRSFDLHKAVVRVLLCSDLETRGARVEVRAVHAFVAVSLDPRVAKVAFGLVNDWRGSPYNHRLHRLYRRRGTRGADLVVIRKDGVHNHFTRAVDLEELMSRTMRSEQTGLCDA